MISRVAVACLAWLAAVLSARADLPGTLAPAAAGDGHLWWVVESPEPKEESRADDGKRFLLMHHAALEPAPTERLVTRLFARPDALAAEDATVYIVTPREGDRRRMVLSLRTARNPEVGHWYTVPRQGPEILAPIERDGELVGFTVAGESLYALLRVEREGAATPELVLLVLPPQGAGTPAWSEVPPPPFDAASAVTLATIDGRVHAVGTKGGVPFILRREADAWINAPGAIRLGQTPTGEAIGAIGVGNRVVLVERKNGAESPARIELSNLRPDGFAPWASFTEPSTPWFVGGLGPDAAVLALDERARGTVRMISPSASAPTEPVTLAPPSLASGRWIHLPIVGFLSVALVLAAVIFGSDSYLDPARLRQDGIDERPAARPVRRGAHGGAEERESPNEDDEARPIGAPLSQRAVGFTVDLLPALAAVWWFERGNPLDLLQVPVFMTDLEGGRAALLALGIAWAFATVGDLCFGRSLGKRFAGLEIRSSKGGPASFGARLVRSLASAIVVASPIVQLVALIHPRVLGPAEMLSGTCVVDARGEA
ncbi:MAG: RDD family protein [Planctomycetaceae bacterium]|nr:RDD family protein [Planctomycetaceae bacterium]